MSDSDEDSHGVESQGKMLKRHKKETLAAQKAAKQLGKKREEEGNALLAAVRAKHSSELAAHAASAGATGGAETPAPASGPAADALADTTAALAAAALKEQPAAATSELPAAGERKARRHPPRARHLASRARHAAAGVQGAEAARRQVKGGGGARGAHRGGAGCPGTVCASAGGGGAAGQAGGARARAARVAAARRDPGLTGGRAPSQSPSACACTKYEPTVTACIAAWRTSWGANQVRARVSRRQNA